MRSERQGPPCCEHQTMLVLVRYGDSSLRITEGTDSKCYQSRRINLGHQNGNIRRQNDPFVLPPRHVMAGLSFFWMWARNKTPWLSDSPYCIVQHPIRAPAELGLEPHYANCFLPEYLELTSACDDRKSRRGKG